MYNEQELFDESNMIKDKWIKLPNLGVSFSGTYIGKRTAPDNLSGGDQIIYEFIKEGSQFNPPLLALNELTLSML